MTAFAKLENLQALHEARIALVVVQVFKGIKNGVQPVAVKVLRHSDEIQLAQFAKVSHTENKLVLDQALLAAQCYLHILLTVAITVMTKQCCTWHAKSNWCMCIVFQRMCCKWICSTRRAVVTSLHVLLAGDCTASQIKLRRQHHTVLRRLPSATEHYDGVGVHGGEWVLPSQTTTL